MLNKKNHGIYFAVSEKSFLKEIAAKEFWPDESTSASLARSEQEKKKLL